MTATANQPQLVYDADCAFCTRTARWLVRDRRGLDITAWQVVPDLEAMGLTDDMVTTSAWWVEDGQPPTGGAPAVARALRWRGGIWKILGRLIDLRPVRPLAALGYRYVARHRHLLPGATESCRVPDNR